MYTHPRFVTEKEEGERGVSDFLVEHPATAMFHTMRGPSMLEFGILDGDVLIIEKGRTPQLGDIVLAIVDDTYVVRALDTYRGKYTLKAGNPDYGTLIPGESLEIRGVAVSLMRKYR